MERMQSYNAWRDLANRPEVLLRFACLEGGRGMIRRLPEGEAVILLDYRLTQSERHEVLAHELEHHRRGIYYTASTPLAVVQREETTVRRAVADRLVPPVDLAGFVARKLTVGEPVRAEDVAEEFGVTVATARIAVTKMRVKAA